MIALELVEKKDLEPMQQADFSDFWALYPRRVAKLDARKAWDRIPQSLHVAILTSLFEWRRIWQDRGELDFVPYPATWLRGERWEDEFPQHHSPYTDKPMQTEVKREERAETKPMPAHVVAALARLRDRELEASRHTRHDLRTLPLREVLRPRSDLVSAMAGV
jgi:hypothetical protein